MIRSVTVQLSFDSPDTPSGCLTVGELIHEMKASVESEFTGLYVEGEISNFTKARSGHCYFTLKDGECQLSCVMWRSRARSLRKDLEDGILVRARGDATIYAARGQLQMQVSSVRLAGEGALQQAFEALKYSLGQEGLFDESHKKPLPALPAVIGIITSGDGAALHDILTTLRRRFPPVRVQLCSVPVQGDHAAPRIIKAIECFHRERHSPGPDVLIVGRGGGSLEDLWAFNEEAVARAVHAASIPVISAVGHETDFSICDFVADVRAATPSMAAEIAVPNGRKLDEAIRKMARRSEALVKHQISRSENRVKALRQSRALHAPVNQLRRQQLKLDELLRRLDSAVRYLIRTQLHRAERLNARLHSLHPRNPLERGFVRVQKTDGSPVPRGVILQKGEDIDIHFKDVKRCARVSDTPPAN